MAGVVLLPAVVPAVIASVMPIAVDPHNDPHARVGCEVAGAPDVLVMLALVIATTVVVVVAVAEAHPVRGGVRTHDKCQDAKNRESFHGHSPSFGMVQGFIKQYTTNQ